jgi:hypothetical protein
MCIASLHALRPEVLGLAEMIYGRPQRAIVK